MSVCACSHLCTDGSLLIAFVTPAFPTEQCTWRRRHGGTETSLPPATALVLRWGPPQACSATSSWGLAELPVFYHHRQSSGKRPCAPSPGFSACLWGTSHAQSTGCFLRFAMSPGLAPVTSTSRGSRSCEVAARGVPPCFSHCSLGPRFLRPLSPRALRVLISAAAVIRALKAHLLRKRYVHTGHDSKGLKGQIPATVAQALLCCCGQPLCGLGSWVNTAGTWVVINSQLFSNHGSVKPRLSLLIRQLSDSVLVPTPGSSSS